MERDMEKGRGIMDRAAGYMLDGYTAEGRGLFDLKRELNALLAADAQIELRAKDLELVSYALSADGSIWHSRLCADALAEVLDGREPALLPDDLLADPLEGALIDETAAEGGPGVSITVTAPDAGIREIYISSPVWMDLMKALGLRGEQFTRRSLARDMFIADVCSGTRKKVLFRGVRSGGVMKCTAVAPSDRETASRGDGCRMFLGITEGLRSRLRYDTGAWRVTNAGAEVCLYAPRGWESGTHTAGDKAYVRYQDDTVSVIYCTDWISGSDLARFDRGGIYPDVRAHAVRRDDDEEVYYDEEHDLYIKDGAVYVPEDIDEEFSYEGFAGTTGCAVLVDEVWAGNDIGDMDGYIAGLVARI